MELVASSDAISTSVCLNKNLTVDLCSALDTSPSKETNSWFGRMRITGEM